MLPNCDRRLLAALVGVLSWPWSVHTVVVTSSAIGARPLAGSATACGILLGCTLVSASLSAWAWRQHAPQASSSTNLSRSARWMVACICAGGIFAFVLPLLFAATLPVVAYDALWYRLPVIAQWLDAGAVRWVVTDDQVRNGYPLGQEAVSALVAAAIGSLQWTDVTSFVFVASGALTLWLIAEACGIRRAFAAAAAAVFVLAPIMILNGSSGYVDAAFGGATVTLLGLAAVTCASRRCDALGCAMLGMAAGNVLALKGTGLPFTLVTGLALLGAFWLSRPRASRTRALAKASVLRMPRIWLLTLACAAPGLFWHARNLFHAGNPLWPVTVHLAGRTLPGVGSMDQILDVATNTPPELVPLNGMLRVLATWSQWRGPAQVFDERLAGLGWAWPALALPSTLWFLYQRIRRRRHDSAIVAWLVLLTALCFLLQPMAWWSRYTVWVWGAGALALAIEAEHLARSGRRRLLMTALCLLNVLVLSEASVALCKASGAGIAMLRWFENDARYARRPMDAHRPINAAWWIPQSFWSLGLERDVDVCRGVFEPNSDDAIIDGVLAQLSPRPHVHLVADAGSDWTQVRSRARGYGCKQLLLLQGSPVLEQARRDPRVIVERSMVYDPVFAVSLGEVGLAQVQPIAKLPR